MALTVRIVNSKLNADGDLPSGSTVVAPSMYEGQSGVTKRTPIDFNIASSSVRNATATTAYTNLATELDSAVDTYLATFYDATESITFDVVINSVVPGNSASTIWGTGSEQHVVNVTILEKHD